MKLWKKIIIVTAIILWSFIELSMISSTHGTYRGTEMTLRFIIWTVIIFGVTTIIIFPYKRKNEQLPKARQSISEELRKKRRKRIKLLVIILSIVLVISASTVLIRNKVIENERTRIEAQEKAHIEELNKEIESKIFNIGEETTVLPNQTVKIEEVKIADIPKCAPRYTEQGAKRFGISPEENCRPLTKVEEGFKVLAVKISVKNTSDNSIDYSPYYLLVYDEFHHSYERKQLVVYESRSGLKPFWAGGNLNPEEISTGWVFFKVLEESSKFDIQYKPFDYLKPVHFKALL